MENLESTASDTELEANAAPLFFPGDYTRIYRYILSMVRDVKEAEDLTQETFIRAVRSHDSLHDQAALSAWLYKIATHATLDRLRQYARNNLKEYDTDLDEVEVAEPCAPTLQKIAEQDEMSSCVQDYLNRLPDNYRAVILLHDVHGQTANEISHLLDESLETVKIRLHRARLRLRAALQSGCDFSVDEDNVLTCESK